MARSRLLAGLILIASYFYYSGQNYEKYADLTKTNFRVWENCKEIFNWVYRFIMSCILMIFFRQGKFHFFDKPSPLHTGLPRLGVSNDGKTQQVEDGL